jgi:hypothetical protein
MAELSIPLLHPIPWHIQNIPIGLQHNPTLLVNDSFAPKYGRHFKKTSLPFTDLCFFANIKAVNCIYRCGLPGAAVL